MFACILKTKPLKSSSSGSISLSLVILGCGEGAYSVIHSKNSLIPKLCNAVPKKTGVCEPDKYFFMSNCSYTPFIKAISSVIA